MASIAFSGLTDPADAFMEGLPIATGFLCSSTAGIYLIIEYYLREIAQVTDQRRVAMISIRDQEEVILRADGLAATAAGVAHEFRSLLQPVVLGIGVLGEPSIPDEMKNAVKAKIEKSLNEADQLITELIDLSERGLLAGKSRVILVSEFLMGLTELASQGLPPTIQLEVMIGPEICRIRGYESQLFRAINNLLINAREAIGENSGTIRVASRSIGWDHVEITVGDTGPGMSPEVLAHVFEPLYSTKTRSRGTGLGLPVVNRIIQAHGGKISLASEEGKGTTVTITLPMAAATKN